jgi:hypothetical protein
MFCYKNIIFLCFALLELLNILMFVIVFVVVVITFL